MSTVLVIGATGNVGRHVVGELRRRGVPVRAFVRDAQRAAGLLGAEVELAVGDLAEPATIRRALRGVGQVFLACGNIPGQVELETNAIEAAEVAGVERVVKLSTAAASADSPLLFPRWQGRIEERLRAAPVPWVLLHPRDYMTNVLTFADTVRHTGKLFAPLGDAKTAMIHPRDVGAVAAVALTGDGHEGRTYVLSGPEAITYERIAADLSAATGRSIGFVDVPEEAARQGMLDQGLPPFLVDFLIALFAAMREGIAEGVTDTVAALTGRDPRSFAEFAREHAAVFAV